MTQQQELELVSYIKDRVKFDGDKCSTACLFFDGDHCFCNLFFNHIGVYSFFRHSDCHKFFD